MDISVCDMTYCTVVTRHYYMKQVMHVLNYNANAAKPQQMHATGYSVALQIGLSNFHNLCLYEMT